MKLPDLPQVTKRSSETLEKDNKNSTNESTTPENSEKSHASESASPDDKNVQSASDDLIIINKEMSDVKISDSNESTVVPKVEKSHKKSNNISAASGPPLDNGVIVLDDSDEEIASDMEIDDDID